MTGRLVVLSGLPGVGKTSVAETIAARTGLVHLAIDAVEEAILACGLSSGWRVGVAAYEATRAMAEQNLRLGLDGVVDAVNDSEGARQTWCTAAARTGAHLDFVHLVISDVHEHERRIGDRDRGLSHVGEPTWSDVLRRRTRWDGVALRWGRVRSGPRFLRRVTMLNWLRKLRRVRGDARAVEQGPEAVGKRAGRRAINKAARRALR